MLEEDMTRPKISDVQCSLRLPTETVERATKLADRLSELDVYRSFHPSGVSTSVVYRLALTKGLEVLEAEFAPTKKGGR